MYYCDTHFKTKSKTIIYAFNKIIAHSLNYIKLWSLANSILIDEIELSSKD